MFTPSKAVILFFLYNPFMKNSFSFLWAILASMTWGLTYTLDDKILRSISPLNLAIVNAFVTLLLFVPIALFQNPHALTEVVHAKQLWLVLLSSVLISFAGLFILYGIKELGASTASIIEISYPMFVILFSAILWRERLTIDFFAGALLVLCGSIIIIRGRG